MDAARLARSASKRWVNDDEVLQCPLCSNRFDGGFLDITAMSRTHCRYCGGVFCTNCCNKELYMPEDEVVRPPASNKFKSIIFDPTLKQKACRTCVKILMPRQEALKASRVRAGGVSRLNNLGVGFLDRKSSSDPHFAIVIVRARSLQGRTASPPVDPVCLLTVGHTSSITQPTHSGAEPVWDQCFDFPVPSEHGNSLKLTCYEERAGGKSLIGEGSTRVVESGAEGTWVPITDDRRSVTGEILIRCTYKGARTAKPRSAGGVGAAASSYHHSGAGVFSASEEMEDGDLPILHWLQEKAWLVYVVLLLLSVLYRFALSSGFSGEPIALRSGTPIPNKTTPRSSTHYMTLQPDGNLMLIKGTPGDPIPASPVWETGRAYPKKPCPKCVAMVDATGERLTVRNGKKGEVVWDFSIADNKILSAAIKCVVMMVVVVTRMQAMGTLLGTMFGFVSAALLTPIHGGEQEDGLPAAPGVVIGSSLGVLAAHSAGEGNTSLRHLANLLVLSVAAAAATTAACGWLAGDTLQNGGSAGIIVLAMLASLGSTAAFSLLKHNTLLRRAAATGALNDRDDHDVLPRTHADRAPLMDPKEV
eukprot:g7779.t1